MKRIYIVLNDQDEQRVADYVKKGFKQAEAMRHMIRKSHSADFPAYLRKLSTAQGGTKIDRSPEELCQEDGGIVTDKEGIKVCQIQEGATTRVRSLSYYQD